MTRFKQFREFTIGRDMDKQHVGLKIKSPMNEAEIDEVRDDMQLSLTLAQKVLQDTIAIMTGSKENDKLDSLFIKYFTRGFLPPSGFCLGQNIVILGYEDYMTIKSRFIKVLNGLSADNLVLKTSSMVGKHKNGTDRDVAGTVTHTHFDAINPQKKPHKHYYTYNFDKHTGKPLKYSAIKLKIQHIGTDVGTQTLIHEACHKYWGAADCYYIDRAGRPSDIRIGTGFEYAMINADTYARFACDCANLDKLAKDMEKDRMSVD